MDAAAIIAALTAAAKAAMQLYADYQAGKVILSEQDAQKVHAALLDAEAATAAMRLAVDASLEAASKR